ncbi:MAG: 16S rRNA (uracil(1498)-N(3))-methyltransferase [Blastocatellia bacterium]
MPGHRFFSPPENFTSSNAVISGDEAHHLRKVLRLNLGDKVFIFNGLGDEWLAVIDEFASQSVKLSLEEKFIDNVESPLEITLIQGLIKGDKFDWVIQKAVELGVSKIQPLITEHTDIQPTKGEKRLERWQRIALEATKQSKRRKLTEILSPIKWSELVKTLSTPTIVFAEINAKPFNQVVKDLKLENNAINLIVGSEGGWTAKELKEASLANFYLANLGKRILRAETAAVTAVVLLQHLFGDLN